MVGGREHEAEAGLRNAARDGLRAKVDPRAEGLEQVGRARAAGGRAVAVLGDRATGAGRDEGGGGRDVEGAAPAARAGRVEQIGAVRRDMGRQVAHRHRQARQLIDRLALRPQGDQEGRDLDLGDLVMHDLGEHGSGLARSGPGPEATASMAVVRVVGWACARGSLPGSWTEARGRVRSTPTPGGTGPPRRAALDGGWPSAHHRREPWISRQSGRCRRRPASGSGRRSAALAQPREDRPAVVLDRGGLAVDRARAGGLRRRTPGRAPGGQGRHRASGCPLRAGAGRPRARCLRHPACRGRARRRSGHSLARAAPRRRPGRCDDRLTSVPSSPRYWTRL